MIGKPMDVLEAFPIRKSKHQKQQFRDSVQSYLKTIGYDAMKAKTNNFASSYASIESSAKADLDKLVEDILAVGE